MRRGPNQANSRLRLFWRRLISAAAIYALAVQPLLLAVAGSQLAQAAAFDELALSQLCQPGPHGGSAPSDQQQHPAHQHCLQCFSGAFHLLGAPQPTIVASADPSFQKLHRSWHPLRLSSASQYSIARPRGPPFSA